MSEQEGSRLYDRLMATGFRWNPVPGTVGKDVGQTQRGLEKAQVFDIQNVADYFYGFKPTQWSEKDFPNAAPPYEQYFMEFRYRNRWLGDRATTDPTARFPYAAGVLSEATVLPPDYKFTGGLESLAIFAGAKWIVANTIFIEQQKWDIQAAALMVTGVLPNGELMRPEGQSNFYAFIVDNETPPDVRQRSTILMGDLIKAIHHPSLLATSFLHCKNVVVGTEEPLPKVSRAFQKRRGRPLITYHVLEIEPLKEILRTEGQSETLGLKKALHQVRGHFATYTDENPLFGRVTGTFWKPQHIRGSITEGIAVKDYEVHSPEQA